MIPAGEELSRSVHDGLARRLAELGAEALVVLAASSRDPDLAPFVGPVHLGGSFLIAPRWPRLRERLGMVSPMEYLATRYNVPAQQLMGALTRGKVLRAVAENNTFSAREKNRAFVLMQYFGYLRRAPNDPPNTDFSGLDFWLGKLDGFDGDYRRAEMVKAFLESIEYRARFQTPAP